MSGNQRSDDETREHERMAREERLPGGPGEDQGGPGDDQLRRGQPDLSAKQPTRAWPTQQPPPSGEAWQQPPPSGQPWQEPPPSGQPWQQPPAQPAQPTGQPWQQPPQQPIPSEGWQQPQPPAPGQPWQQQPPAWTGQSGWGQPDAARRQQPPYGSSPLAILAAVVLLIFGAFLTLIGGVGVLAGSLLDDATMRQAREQLSEINPTIRVEDVIALLGVVFGFLLVLGILHLVSAIGVFLHRQWGRIIGILVAVLGTLLGVLMVTGAAQAGVRADLTLPLIIAIAYGFSLFALIAAGNHFRRRWS